MSKKIEVDAKFAGSGQSLRRRRRNRARRRAALMVLAGLVSLALVALMIWGVVGLLPDRKGAATPIQTATPEDALPSDDQVSEEGFEQSDDTLELVQSEGSSQAGIVLQAAAAEAFLDIRGAPMIIVLPEGPAQGRRRVVLPQQIHPQRARQGDEVTVIDDVLFDASQRVQLTLPSSSADLAAFQARREFAIVPDAKGAAPVVADPEVVTAGVEVTIEQDGGSWGEVVGDDAGANDGTVSYVETVIEDTTTDVPATESNRRQKLFRDVLVRVEQPTKLQAVLEEEGLSAGEATRITEFASRTGARLDLAATDVNSAQSGGLVALRLTTAVTPDAQLMQMSLYAPDRYLLSIAQPGPGRFEQSADPWYDDNLLRKAERVTRARSTSEGEVRLKDAVYSAALRNGLSSELVGELMVMLSRVQDLDRIATQSDRLRIVIAQDDRVRTPAGQILFAALSGEDFNFECYVMQPTDANNAPYGCFNPTAPGAAGGGQTGAALGAGYIIPVAGTKTSNFGPRHHPILKKTVNHNGVDWAAPTGTPVKATAGGTISRANVSPSYGNIIYIDHAGGAHSRYAHLNKFADGIRNGVRVEAGQLIGYVGTTGRSTGPHLHFELHIGGQPVDPLAIRAARASGAVEALVAQIIKVESAGNARAKNTRSSATGLGQFISSTWIRMMQTYRPDLVKRLNRQQLLDLRFDPALSRAMVTNLARENEAFLRARGHAITPGRLYLAHFLGPAGANIALKANPQSSVLDVMGAGVVNANPFLKGRNVAWMTNWSDRKMGRIRKGAAAPSAPSTPAAPQIEPAEVKRYKAGVKGLLEVL